MTTRPSLVVVESSRSSALCRSSPTAGRHEHCKVVVRPWRLPALGHPDFKFEREGLAIELRRDGRPPDGKPEDGRRQREGSEQSDSLGLRESRHPRLGDEVRHDHSDQGRSNKSCRDNEEHDPHPAGALDVGDVMSPGRHVPTDETENRARHSVDQCDQDRAQETSGYQSVG